MPCSPGARWKFLLQCEENDHELRSYWGGGLAIHLKISQHKIKVRKEVKILHYQVQQIKSSISTTDLN